MKKVVATCSTKKYVVINPWLDTMTINEGTAHTVARRAGVDNTWLRNLAPKN